MKRTFRLLLVCLCITALAAMVSCAINIGGIEYDKVDPGQEFTERPADVSDWAMPTPTTAEEKAGLLAYVTPDPGDYKPFRGPKIGEHVNGLSTFLTPGEDRALWFAVSALENVQGLEVSVDTGKAPVTVDVRHIHFWPQRTQWRGFQWYMTPELLLPCANGNRTIPTQRGVLKEEAFNIVSGETAGFWLTVSAKPEALSGRHRGTVTVKSKGKADLALSFQIEILPFKINHPEEKRWQLYADLARTANMSDQQILDEFRDFKRHGFNGLVEVAIGNDYDLTPLKTGGKPKVGASYYKKIDKLCKQAGIFGPHVVTAGGIPEKVAETLGLNVDLHKGEWPAEVKEGVKAFVRELIEVTKNDTTWYFYGPDEPSGDNTYAVQTYECWGGAGANTYATVISTEFLKKSAEYLTSPCFYAPMIRTEDAWKNFYNQCVDAGVEFTWYGTGCYVNPYPQEQFMYHNRYGAGFFFWKTKSLSAVAWTLCRPHDDVFNDFDGSDVNGAEPKEQAFVYPHLLKADDWSTFQGDIPTIAWESHREGWNDYGYIYTLQTLIEEKEQGSSAARAAARDAQVQLDQIVDGVPFANLWGAPEFSSAKLEQGRLAVVNLIKRLRLVR